VHIAAAARGAGAAAAKTTARGTLVRHRALAAPSTAATAQTEVPASVGALCDAIRDVYRQRRQSVSPPEEQSGSQTEDEVPCNPLQTQRALLRGG
jgi:hypothetical protein